MGEMVENKRSVVKTLILILFLLLAILAGTYYALRSYNPDMLANMGVPNIEIPSSISLPSGAEPSVKDLNMEDAKDEKIRRLEAELEQSKTMGQNVVSKLGYSIKPLDKLLGICLTQRIGRWEIPQDCANELVNNAKALISQNNSIVAIEVIGVVDNLPYAGLSPELKQEGLASFRALEAMEILAQNLPNTAIFEGVSLQEENKRGFVARAYFVENNK